MHKNILQNKLEDDASSLKNIVYGSIADYIVRKYESKVPREEDSVFERLYNYYKAIDKNAEDTIETLATENLTHQGYKEVDDTKEDAEK